MEGGAFADVFGLHRLASACIVLLRGASSYFVVLRRVSKTTLFWSGYFCFFVP
jgi:hypothetical protein